MVVIRLEHLVMLRARVICELPQAPAHILAALNLLIPARRLYIALVLPLAQHSAIVPLWKEQAKGTRRESLGQPVHILILRPVKLTIVFLIHSSMKKNAAACEGFTLLELLIVSVIMLIVTGGSIAALATFQDRQRALVAAKSVQQMMWSGQTKARVRESPSGCNPLNGYRVLVSTSNVQLHAVCNGVLFDHDTATSGTNPLQQINYPTGVRANVGTGEYMFFALEGGVSSGISTTPSPTALQTRSLTFCSASGATCPTDTPSYTFTVNSFGAISNVSSSFGTATDL